jgi:hypothetical protein
MVVSVSAELTDHFSKLSNQGQNPKPQLGNNPIFCGYQVLFAF